MDDGAPEAYPSPIYGWCGDKRVKIKAKGGVIEGICALTKWKFSNLHIVLSMVARELLSLLGGSALTTGQQQKQWMGKV